MAERGTRHIFLAPHYDDVALSCGGLVAQLSNGDVSPTIVTVMGGVPEGPLTEFADGQHTRWGFGPSDAVEMRRREDRCAATALRATSVWLDLLDAIYRSDRYTSDEDIFGAIHPDDSDLAERIVTTLDRELALRATDVCEFYVPLAIGNHVDHQLTLIAGQMLAGRGLTVWGYEDFPYAGDPVWQGAIDVSVSQLGCGAARIVRLTEQDLDRKAEAVRCYASQLEVIFRFQGDPEQSIRGYALHVGGGRPAERFWPIPSSPSHA